MDTKHPTLMHRWFEEVWNQRKTAVIDELFASDGVAHGLKDMEGNPVHGPDGFKRFHKQFTDSFPDVRIHVEDSVSEGDRIAVRCRVTGTHRGDSFGVAASHKPVEFTGLCLARIRDGKIVEAWNEFNFLELLQAIGAHHPKPPGATA